MNTYKTITLEQAVNIPFIQLVNEYTVNSQYRAKF